MGVIRRDSIGLLILTLICCLPFISAPIALILGVGGALFFKPQSTIDLNFLSSRLLKVAIVLMGFGMSWSQALESSVSGFVLTAVSVTATLLIGILLGKLLGVHGKTTLLISAGTAICGGSAIAAVSPIIDAKNKQLSFALIVVFVLNAIALITFPLIGKWLNLSQEVFGNWAAIAIHDTTSVVGAGEAYGNQALQIATTVKLTRALWIIPMALVLGAASKKNGSGISVPWFILFFILAMIVAHLLPQWSSVFSVFDWIGRRGMIIALLFIGMSIRFDEIIRAGFKPFFLGVTLWSFISVLSVLLLNYFWS